MKIGLDIFPRFLFKIRIWEIYKLKIIRMDKYNNNKKKKIFSYVRVG